MKIIDKPERLNVVHNVDCLEFMRSCVDNQYSLSICDPPYGIFSEKKKTGFIRKYKTSETANSWDVRPGAEYFKELFRISKHQIIWGMQYFLKDLPDCSSVIVWDKQTGDSYFADGEIAYCSLPGTVRIFKHQWAGAFKASEVGQKAIQACQKPIALYKWVLQKFAKPGWTIFDSHVGSGSSRIAAHDMGFDFEGCEIDFDHWEGQGKRYEKHIQQQDLFSAAEYQEMIFQKG